MAIFHCRRLKLKFSLGDIVSSFRLHLKKKRKKKGGGVVFDCRCFSFLNVPCFSAMLLLSLHK